MAANFISYDFINGIQKVNVPKQPKYVGPVNAQEILGTGTNGRLSSSILSLSNIKAMLPFIGYSNTTYDTNGNRLVRTYIDTPEVTAHTEERFYDIDNNLITKIRLFTLDGVPYQITTTIAYSASDKISSTDAILVGGTGVVVYDVSDITALNSTTPNTGDYAIVAVGTSGNQEVYFYDGTQWVEILQAEPPALNAYLQKVEYVSVAFNIITLSENPVGDVAVFSMTGPNSQPLELNTDFTITGNTITFDASYDTIRMMIMYMYGPQY